jgi:hypothetical protein
MQDIILPWACENLGNLLNLAILLPRSFTCVNKARKRELLYEEISDVCALYTEGR